MKGRSMIWRHEQDMFESMIEQPQLVLSAVVLLRVKQIGNLSVVSIVPYTFRGKAHSYLYSLEQLLLLPPSPQTFGQSPALSQDMEKDSASVPWLGTWSLVVMVCLQAL